MASDRNLRLRVVPYLDALKAREITNRAVAEELGCNEQHLSRVLAGLNLKKDPAPDRAARKALAKARREHLAHCAATLSPEAAAAACGVSVRTIYRHLKKR